MFYISSRGHSGTGWLGKVLSCHPNIICFHGTRSLPPYSSGINDISVNDFIDGLLQMEKNTRGHKMFGACHGYYGTSAKSYVEEHGGLFMGILRDPVLRVNSIFTSYLPSRLTCKIIRAHSGIKVYELVNRHKIFINKMFNNIIMESSNQKEREISWKDNIIKFMKAAKMGAIIGKVNQINKSIKSQQKARLITNIKERIQDISINNFMDKISALPDELIVEYVINTFVMACNQTFKYDAEICSICDDDQIIKMEEMTTSREYFNQLVYRKLTTLDTGGFVNRIGDNIAESKYLDLVFAEQDTVNLHSSQKVKNPDKIFANWPVSFRKYFEKELSRCMAIKWYNRFNYFQP